MSYEMLFHAPDVLFVPAHVFPLIHPKKTVMTVHDIAALRFPKIYNRFEQWYSLWSAKYAVKKLWRVIVPSTFTKNELKTLIDSDQKNIIVVHHGFDQKFTERKSEFEIQEALKKYKIQKPFFLSLGRIEEKKNTLGTVRAFEMLKEVHPRDDLQLVLIGKPGYGGEKVGEAIHTSKFAKNILHPGYVEQRDIPAIFQAAEAFVFPSFYEGFGIPVLESFASGVPVITSKNSSTEEIAGDGAVLVDPQDIKGITDAMHALCSDINLRKKLIEKGHIRVQNFSWEKCAEETLKVLL
jgi:glycosyltransferase involved in cell wall biosynthesis